MRAITIETFGGPDGLRPAHVPKPSPAPGQVLVEVEAIGVGGVDAVIRRGTLGGSGVAAGAVPGSEVGGRVIEVGTGVDAEWIGRRVWAFTGITGAYAEFAVADLDDVTPLPDALPATDAVTLGSAATVAHFALRHAHVAAGESVLVRGAAGSIGIAAVQLARSGGASAVGVTTSSDVRGERLVSLGATHVLDRSGRTPDGASPSFDVILDVVGGEAMPGFFDLLRPNGRLVALGVVGGYPPADFGMSLMRAFQRSLSFATFSLNTVDVRERNHVRAELFADAANARLQAVVHDVLPLDRAADAHRAMDAGEVFGRIVLTP